MKNRKSFFETKLETRAESDGKKKICGYFAKFNCETKLFDNCFESIAAGAFLKSLANNDIRCLFNHQDGDVLGRTGSGTLALREDATGLYGEVEINENDTMAMNIYARVMRGDISGCSFGFLPEREDCNCKNDGYHYIIREANTLEVSICTFPAYEETEIHARKQEVEKLKKQSASRRKAAFLKRLEELKNVKTD